MGEISWIYFPLRLARLGWATNISLSVYLDGSSPIGGLQFN